MIVVSNDRDIKELKAMTLWPKNQDPFPFLGSGRVTKCLEENYRAPVTNYRLKFYSWASLQTEIF